MITSNLLPSVAQLSLDVAAYIAQERAAFDVSTVEEKSLNSLVSYVDRTAEERIVEGLQALFPEAGFLAEEGTATSKGEEWQWIIDPLDGTTNFIHGIPFCGINIALTQNGVVKMGVIADVFHNDVYHAIEGKGAFKNNLSIQVNKETQLRNTLMATGFPHYDFEPLPKYLNIMGQLMQCTRGIRRMGAATLDLAYTAAGKFDGFFEFSLQPWDVSAGGIILKEAGGVVTDFSGGDNWLFGKEIMAGNPTIHAELCSLMQSSDNR